MDTSTKEISTDLLPDLPNRKDFDAQWYLTETRHAFDAQRFWMAYRPWLMKCGYTLFDLGSVWENGTPFWIPPSTAVSASVPYALYHREEDAPPATWHIMSVQARFAYGQDSRGRNIAIKVIKSESEEEHIYNNLLKCPELLCTKTFPNVLPPLRVLRISHQLSFVVMPMWGDRLLLGDIKTVKEVMDFITDLLQGLMFLHKQRIAHRDIAECNVMVNYVSAIPFRNDDALGPLLERHRSSSQARYCLFDYNLSIQFPLGMPIENYRSPSTEAFRGWDCYHPRDVYQGEFEYNPFAFDVGCLGNLFMIRFADAIPTINMLAPLFDRMTTHVISQRFTAAQAYEFCTEIVRGFSDEELGAALFYRPMASS
ncbi:Cyclin-dependent kinase 2 [Grifola frondosa]|uniref:Cyclin-dependent kinase 2 n=1 Tax=Grifola frondosa TaxID=5627 RepID=A0A1C7MJ54_GRIFR|nr:Cyclin-dependent kinase 2 [Grifola frondosa]